MIVEYNNFNFLLQKAKILEKLEKYIASRVSDDTPKNNANNYLLTRGFFKRGRDSIITRYKVSNAIYLKGKILSSETNEEIEQALKSSVHANKQLVYRKFFSTGDYGVCLSQCLKLLPVVSDSTHQPRTLR